MDKSVALVSALQRASTAEEALDTVDEMTHSVDVISLFPRHLGTYSVGPRGRGESKQQGHLLTETDLGVQLSNRQTNTDSPPMCHRTP